MTSFDRTHDQTPPSSRQSKRGRSPETQARTQGPRPAVPLDRFADQSHGAGCNASNRSSADRRESSPGAILDYSIGDGHLRIEIKGVLDLRCAFALLLIVKAVDDSIRSCVLDASEVEQVFDSGIAALILAANALTKIGVGQVEICGLERDSIVLKPFVH